MITPAFSVSQSVDYITIIIKTSHVRSQDIEFDVDGNVFHFSLQPYYLRLELPGNVIEDDRAKAEYDAANGDITVKLPKETPGEHFADLDMLTKLLTRKQPIADIKASKPLIEVIGSDSSLTASTWDEAEAINWHLAETIPETESIQTTEFSYYGFNNQYTGYFRNVSETGNEANALLDPEKSTRQSRTTDRIEAENQKFEPGYYVADFISDEDIKDCIKYKTRFWLQLRALEKLRKENASKSSAEISDLSTDMASLNISRGAETLDLSPEEKRALRDLPRREYLISDSKSIYLGLIAILFAFCYEERTTQGDPTVESAWTISILAPNLATLDDNFTTIEDLAIACTRRALAYPLYRHWELANKCLEDVYVILRLGRIGVLQALLETRRILEQHDVYYVYSKVVVEDYCVWIQFASENVLQLLAKEIHHLKLTKEKVEWNLEGLEQTMFSAGREEEEGGEDESEEEEESSEEEESDEEEKSEKDEDEGDDPKPEDVKVAVKEQTAKPADESKH